MGTPALLLGATVFCRALLVNSQSSFTGGGRGFLAAQADTMASGSSGSAVDAAHSAHASAPAASASTTIDCTTPTCDIYTVERMSDDDSAQSGPLTVKRHDVAQAFVGYAQREVCLEAGARDIPLQSRTVQELVVADGEEPVFDATQMAYLFDEESGVATVCACGQCVARPVSSCTVYSTEPNADGVLRHDAAECRPFQEAALQFRGTAPPLRGSSNAFTCGSAAGKLVLLLVAAAFAIG